LAQLARACRAALPPFTVFMVVLGIWYLVTYAFLTPRRRFLLPPPHQVVADGFLDPDALRDILAALWSTTQVAFVGLAITTGLGMTFAIMMGQARWIERSFYPWAVVIQTMPILATIPLIGFWLGFGFWSRTTICILISLFPLVTNTLFGLKSVDAGLRDLFTLRRVGRWQRLIRLELPSALPAILTGLRISGGMSVVGAIVGDFFFRQGEPGIGRLIDNYAGDLQFERLFAAVTFSSLLGLAVFWSFGLAARLVVGPWHESGRRT
jgi:NitT/TauT family transport system permease protein